MKKTMYTGERCLMACCRAKLRSSRNCCWAADITLDRPNPLNAGTAMYISRPMIEMTTRSSIKVKARARRLPVPTVMLRFMSRKPAV